MTHDFSNESINSILSHHDNEDDLVDLTCPECQSIFSLSVKDLTAFTDTLPSCSDKCAASTPPKAGLTVNCNKNPKDNSTSKTN